MINSYGNEGIAFIVRRINKLTKGSASMIVN